MTSKKTEDAVMLDPYSVGEHTMADDWKHPASGDHPPRGSVAADTRYFTAVCSGCSFRGQTFTEARSAQDEAHQHMVDYPGHSATVEEKAAPG